MSIPLAKPQPQPKPIDRRLELHVHWFVTPPKLQALVLHLAKHPTESNAGYATGYLAALHDHAVLPNLLYSYMLALVNTLPHDKSMCDLILSEYQPS